MTDVREFQGLATIRDAFGVEDESKLKKVHAVDEITNNVLRRYSANLIVNVSGLKASDVGPIFSTRLPLILAANIRPNRFQQ